MPLIECPSASSATSGRGHLREPAPARERRRLRQPLRAQGQSAGRDPREGNPAQGQRRGGEGEGGRSLAPRPPRAAPAVARSAADRFLPPWISVETVVCFIVRDNGQALAYVYFSRMSRDGARRPSCLPATGPGGSLRTSTSYRSCYCFRGAAEYLPPFSNKTERSS